MSVALNRPRRRKIVVLGAGTSGLACTIAAADEGADVLLVEKSADIGGTLTIASGHMSGAGTKRQKSKGIDDSPDAHYDDVWRISHGTASPALLRKAVDAAPDTIDWLDDNGFEFAPETPVLIYGHMPYSVPRTYYGVDDGMSVLKVLKRLLSRHVEAGNVTIMLSTSVTSLNVEDSRLHSVTVSSEGRTTELTGDAYVLATGGYAANPELFEAIEQRPLFTAAKETSTGDGIKLAQSIGAMLTGTGNFLPTFGGIAPEGDHPIDFAVRPLLTSEARPPYEVYVDANGRRFVAEDADIDTKERALLKLSDMTFWTVFDERAVRESHPIIRGWTPDELRAAANEYGGIHSAPDLSTLARAAGIDPKGLHETCDRYNAAVVEGSDREFGREHLPAPITESPFYAIRNHGITLRTFAGIDVDDDLRVRTSDGTVIDGLFAVGELLGAARLSGHSFAGGMSVTPALTFGRLLGSALAHAKANAKA